MSKKFRLKKRTKQIIVALVFLSLGVVTILAMILIIFNRNEDSKGGSQSQDSSQADRQGDGDDKTITMLATGDWIAHDAINADAKTDRGYDYSAMTQPFKSIFAKSDINFCNQATISAGEKFGIAGYPSFNAPLEWSRDMVGSGCNVINTGTNHTNDKGQEAITANLDYLDSLKGVIARAGSNRSSDEQQEVSFFEKNGVKFAFLSYSTYSNSPNPNPYSLNRFDDALVVSQMKEARERADIIIVSMRWGTEYSDSINDAQKQQASKLASLGADIVLGHGTHTLQAVDRLPGLDGRETIVWYGLGNFLNAQLETGGLTGCVAKLSIDAVAKKVTSNECLPFYQHYEWSASDKASENLMARHNFQIMPLYKANDSILSKSQLGTTVEDQTLRIQKATNALTKVNIISQ